MAAKHNNVWNTFPSYLSLTKVFWKELQDNGWRVMFEKFRKFSTVRVGGQLIGTDLYGNKYYENPEYKLEPLQRRYRWVEYADEDWDASQVPAEWHGWLCYTHDIVPGTPEANELNPFYRKTHLANQTGKSTAYFPPNFVGSPTYAGVGARVGVTEWNPATPASRVDLADDSAVPKPPSQ